MFRIEKLSALINRQMLLYVGVGLFGAFIEWYAFLLLTTVVKSILIANIIAFHLAFLTCFFLHHFFTYKLPYSGLYNLIKGLSKFGFLMYAQLFVGSIFLFLMIKYAPFSMAVSKVLQIGLLVPVSYMIQKKFIFN